MKPLLLLSCCLLSLTICAQKKTKKQPPVDLTSLDKTFNQILKDWHGAGLAVAVVNKDTILYAKGFGYRNMDKKLPVTPNTLFAIGSCTKAFTASLIGWLSQEGKVDIDKPVRNYDTDIKFYNDAMNNSITLRHMMSHTTGLPRHDFSWYFFTTASRDSMLQRLPYLEPTATVGAQWQYNNFMFTAQGALAQKLTGKSWEDNIQERFFKPLHMSRSGFYVKDLDTSSDASIGYEVKKDSIIKKVDYYTIGSMGPAGSINSSVTEMAHWVKAWINGGKYNGKEIIPAAFALQAISSQAIVSPGLPTKEHPDLYFGNYGFGWMLSSYRGHYRVEHGGNINGFSASTSFYPTDSIGIIVLSNQDGSPIPSIVRNIITDRLLQLPYFDWSADIKKSVTKAKAAQKEADKQRYASRKPNTKPSHPLADYAGNYNNPGYGTIHIYTKQDSLFASLGSETLYLRHYHYDIFEPFSKDPKEGIDTTDAPPFKVQFETNMQGDIDHMDIPFEAGLKPISFTKQLDVKELKKEDLQKYIGDYELMGATVKVYIKNNQLYVLVPGQPEYELLPVDKDKFAIKVAKDYYVQFNSNATNEIEALTFIQPNGNFKATRKKQ